jgi:hypothetical protein
LPKESAASTILTFSDLRIVVRGEGLFWPMRRRSRCPGRTGCRLRVKYQIPDHRGLRACCRARQGEGFFAMNAEDWRHEDRRLEDRRLSDLRGGESRLGLEGQLAVWRIWRAARDRNGLSLRSRLDVGAFAGELAHVSILAREGARWRFRLAGTGLRAMLGRESRGLDVGELERCCGQWAWGEALEQVLETREFASGRLKAGGGDIHFWLRLPLSSDGRGVDMVLCHDRYLPIEAIHDPDRAAREASRRLRLDCIEAL